MARTDIEITQELDTEMNSHPELAVLQSNTSMKAFWLKMKQVLVFITGTNERMIDQHKLDVNETITKTETGSEEWYRTKLMSYQHGDALVIQNNLSVYAVEDETKQIIKRVAIKEGTGTDAKIYIKAVKEVGGLLAKLSATEEAGAKAFINKFKIPGTKYDFITADANPLGLIATITVDPMIMDIAGKLLSDSTKEPVLDAVNLHNKTFDFGGTYYTSRLIDAVMDVLGVIDFQVTTTKMDTVLFVGKKESTAGHVELDLPNSTLTYVHS